MGYSHIPVVDAESAQAGAPPILDLSPIFPGKGNSGARRAEVRRILGGRRRTDSPRRRTHRRHQEARQ
ncbi:hypothetical protein BN9982_50055 [Mycobacterium tuberculosis]|nr:hypothetical protein BN9982_50055 [Mycobacterium tuberculosis]